NLCNPAALTKMRLRQVAPVPRTGSVWSAFHEISWIDHRVVYSAPLRAGLLCSAQADLRRTADGIAELRIAFADQWRARQRAIVGIELGIGFDEVRSLPHYRRVRSEQSVLVAEERAVTDPDSAVLGGASDVG